MTMPVPAPGTLIVTCQHCGAVGTTEDFSFPDAGVVCSTPAGSPPGSVDGCCSTAGRTHDEHLAHVRATGDASSRPVNITIAGTYVKQAG